MRRRLIWMLAALTLCMGFAAPSLRVREQRQVAVGGVSETWRLVWSEAPKSICGAEDVAMAITCPCSGWAYGELGDLALVRMRDGREVDRLRLGGLFGKYDAPGDIAAGLAYMQRWPIESGDLDRQERGDRTLLAEIQRRPAPQVIKPADYNHDGQATEFLIQVGTLPCGKRQFVAVGVTKANPRLHAFSSTAHPGEPLTMPLQAWETLLKSDRPEPVLIWQCDDHGSEVRSMLTVAAKDGSISAVDRDYSCASAGGLPDRLVKTTEW